MKTGAIYARFSSDKQTEMSISAQIRACLEYAKKKNIKIRKIYKDEGISGTTANRASYKELLADAMESAFDVILIHKYDRIARDLEEQVTLDRKLNRLGIELIAVAQDYGTGKDANLSKGIQWVLGEYYSANLAEETKKGLRETALKALHNGGYPPFGYDVVDRKYQINELEAEYVRRMFDLCVNHEPYTDLIEEMEKAGIKGKRGKNIKQPQIYEILKNEKYTGTYLYCLDEEKGRSKRRTKPNAIRIEGAIPEIIPREIFEKAQEVMRSRARSGPARKSPYSGLVYCECGAKMHHNKTKRHGHEYQTFCCSAHCGRPIISEDVIDAAAKAYLDELLSEKNLENVKSAVLKLKHLRGERIKSFEESRKERITQKETELSNIVNALSSGVFTDNYEYLNDLISVKRSEIEELKNIKYEEEADYSKWLKALKTGDRTPRAFIKKMIVKQNEVNVISTLTSFVDSSGCGGSRHLVPTINVSYSMAYDAKRRPLGKGSRVQRAF